MNFGSQPPRRAFTLVELLVVIAVIAILAAILFPVFAQARDKARSAACMSNMKQLGTSIQMYVQDYDEQIFFRSTNNANSTRIHTATTGNGLKWWNVLMPYIRDKNVFRCPSDTPNPSVDTNGLAIIPRSYAASASMEALSLAQVSRTVETIVITEAWSTNGSGSKMNTEQWLEAFDGDMAPDPLRPGSMLKYANRHQGGMNCTFFDGHAKWLKPDAIWASWYLSGCSLVHQYPTPRMCDNSYPGCQSSSDNNICNSTRYQPYPAE